MFDQGYNEVQVQTLVRQKALYILKVSVMLLEELAIGTFLNSRTELVLLEFVEKLAMKAQFSWFSGEI